MKKHIFLLLCFFLAKSLVHAEVYENLYVVGNACDAGWNPGSALEMTKQESGVFTWEGPLSDNTTDQARFKFIVAKEWHPSITCRLDVNSHLVVNSGEEYDLFERPTGTEGFDNAFQVSSNGTYRIEINLNTMKMVCTKLSDDGKADWVFTHETFKTSNNETLLYRKLIPPAIEEGEKYPLVIFMHGAGERGSDNVSQLKYGADMFAKASNRETFPAFVLFPQCPSQYFWAFPTQPASYDATTFPADYPIAPANKQVKELIDTYLQMDEIDKDRVYITGISMGGMATFDMACRFPDIFAAAVPVCGGVNTERLNNDVKDIYWRIFHGDADGVVPVQNSRSANAKLTELEADVEYIEYPGVDHDSWVQTFAREDFLPWLFSKTRISNNGDGIQENQSNPIQIYAANKQVTIAQAGCMNYQIYNSTGQLIKSGASSDQSISIGIADAGIYMVKINTSQGLFSQKIMVK